MDLKERNVFLTGATGSFGTAFIKYLIETNNTPKRLVAYSRDWQKQKELRESLGNPCWIQWIIGDVRDKGRLIESMKDIDIVIHAAAIKCIDACENNPTESLKTNVIGTQNVLDVIKHYNIKTYTLISTDKAVLPTTNYGTNKKQAEKLWLASGGNVARYGNVIGSNGSIIPVWRKLISEGVTSLPITDERCTRFWYPMKDAIKLVLTSILDFSCGDLFIPQIPSVRIVDVARAFDMTCHFVGLRPFEKIHEVMIAPDEATESQGYSSGNNHHFLTVEEIRRSIDGI